MFEILEHPADIGFRAYGDSLAGLFESSAVALLSIACEIGNVMPRIEYAICAEGHDHESLLVNWLNAVLYWFDGARIAFRNFRVTDVTSTSISAIALGEPWENTSHRAKLIVKAVTWHQLKVVQSDCRWMAEVYLDI